MEIKCEYCGAIIPESVEQCPYCGATNNAIKRTTDGTPKTIEELQRWYAARNLPPYETTRFFIGINYTEPRAFGIYQDGKDFVVYKNKSNGERVIRYQGTDEAYAVNELYIKLKDEILNQKAHQQSYSTQDFANEVGNMFSETFSRKNMEKYLFKPFISLMIGIFIVILLIILGFALNGVYKGLLLIIVIAAFVGIFVSIFSMFSIDKHKDHIKFLDKYNSFIEKTSSKTRAPVHYLVCVLLIALVIMTPVHNYFKTDYYKYNNTVYLNSHYNWFEYNGYDYDKISRSDIPDELLDNKSRYGFDYSSLKWNSSITQFEDSYYYEEHYTNSGKSHNNSDYDWNSNHNWNSNNTDWDSDW